MYRKIISITFALVSLLSCLGLSASAANTTDTYYTYSWSGYNDRYAYTNARVKSNNSGVYVHVVDNSLPYNGFYASTFYGVSSNGATKKGSSSEYRINDYNHYVIRSGNIKSMYVRIRGHYKDTTYSWGNCTIAWSPDTASQSGLIYLN